MPWTWVLVILVLLALATPAFATTTCTTDEERTMQRLQTLCRDGTRAISTWNRTLDALGHEYHLTTT